MLSTVIGLQVLFEVVINFVFLEDAWIKNFTFIIKQIQLIDKDLYLFNIVLLKNIKYNFYQVVCYKNKLQEKKVIFKEVFFVFN